jgi:hypothetical protein
MLLPLACAAPLALSGCAAIGDGPRTAPPAGGSAVSVVYACEWNIEGGDVLLGETISVSRGPDGPCDGLELGTTQLFELRSNHADDPVKATAEVDVAQDGSFTFEIRVPENLRLNTAVLQAVPADPGCDDPAVLDCPPPSVYFTVRHARAALREVTLAATGLDAPRLTAGSVGAEHSYRPGPADGQVTLVISGNGCETLPRWYVATAPSDSLEIVSETQDVECTDVATRWTSIIELPAEYADFESVKVDNIPAELLPDAE